MQVQLTALSCTGADGRLMDVYTIVVTRPGGFFFRLTSKDFDTYLVLRSADTSEVARNDDHTAKTRYSQVKALLAPGIYTLSVSSKPGASGGYSVSYLPTSASADFCEDAFIVRGITVSDIIDDNDCTDNPSEFADRYLIHLEAGSQVEILVEDFSYSGPNIEVDAPDGKQAYAAAGSGGPYLTKLVYLAPVAGYYTVLVGLLNETGVQYQITIR